MLPEILKEEIASLQEVGYQIQHTIVGNTIYIVFEGYELPLDKFNQSKTDLLVRTSTIYPKSAFDMFWTDKELLHKNNNIPKNAEAIEILIGRNWRRFSIHPYNSKVWNPSEDSLTSYLIYINQRLNSPV